ncbi:35312e2f-e8c5-47d6-9ced-769f335de3aa [Sclerotinia trifoliorum]|uniref:35312e2f-e8c5-47d6-9ced-769f335de3aa n=1 Tax=Sclerotinia trifoliorum TaxID=28548 RepID=A0A8H2W0Q5_9HELO|nr:35312e2f-e8c5-47d6-9ced-769f335de3aa [Sclerotinia trifoliorum]
MEFTNNEMDLLPHSRNFGGIRHWFNNPVHLSDQAIPNSNISLGSHMASAIENVGAERSKLAQGGNGASQSYVLHETSSNIDTMNDPDPDCLMTTPASSRHNSHSTSDANYCQCQGGARTSGSRAGNSRAPPLRPVSRSHLPSIAMMLNNPPLSHASIHPTGNSPMPKSRFDNRMSISNASDSTIVPPISMPEQRYFLLNTLYQICLDATTTYIQALPNHSRTGLQYERRRSYSNRYHPYRGRGQERLYNDDGSKTLMDNIEVISTFLWRKARRDEMAPHRAESDAVMDMKNLYKWGEDLVDGLEERAGNEEARTAVSHAAMSLCGWLRVSEACTLCTEVEEELRDLTYLERERAREAGDGFGDIL